MVKCVGPTRCLMRPWLEQNERRDCLSSCGAHVRQRNTWYCVNMDDFELFRARSLHGGVLGTEQSAVEDADPTCPKRRRPAAESRASNVGFINIATANDANDRRSRSPKIWTRRDDVIAIPEVVRCSNAWVDFSANELPVSDRRPSAERWQRARNAWMSCERSVVGVTLPDESATHEFDVYRLRSFATAAGRIVNRGDYFRVRQRVYPTPDGQLGQLDRLRGPSRSVSGHPVDAVAPPSNSSPPSCPPST